MREWKFLHLFVLQVKINGTNCNLLLHDFSTAVSANVKRLFGLFKDYFVSISQVNKIGVCSSGEDMENIGPHLGSNLCTFGGSYGGKLHNNSLLWRKMAIYYHA